MNLMNEGFSLMQATLKSVLLYSSKEKLFGPQAHAVQMKETHETMMILFEAIEYFAHF